MRGYRIPTPRLRHRVIVCGQYEQVALLDSTVDQRAGADGRETPPGRSRGLGSRTVQVAVPGRHDPQDLRLPFVSERNRIRESGGDHRRRSGPPSRYRHSVQQGVSANVVARCGWRDRAGSEAGGADRLRDISALSGLSRKSFPRARPRSGSPGPAPVRPTWPWQAASARRPRHPRRPATRSGPD